MNSLHRFHAAKQFGDKGRETHPAEWAAQCCLVVTFVTTIVLAGFVWLIPIEVIQQWALDRAKPDPFSRFEAVGSAEFSVWLCRIVVPIMTILVILIWRHLQSSLVFLGDLLRGLVELTRWSSPIVSSRPLSFFDQIRTFGCRGFLVAWMLLFAAHAAHGVGQRIHEWPYFRLNTGQVVLPNISDSNRAVIRYLQSATPPEARILVASDQKLFFLSYYLRPRTLFHRMHPESEHVIPLPEQQRKLVAYRLDELTESDRQQMPHDYTLEYFEHPDLVNRNEILDDRAWISFVRQQQQNPSLVPSYLVRLRKVEGQ